MGAERAGSRRVGKSLLEWHPLVAAEWEADKVAELEKKISQSKHRVAQNPRPTTRSLSQRWPMSAFRVRKKSISAWIYSVNAAMASRIADYFSDHLAVRRITVAASRSTEIALSIEGNHRSRERLRRILSIALWTSCVAS